MVENDNIIKVNNPHDKFFREVSSKPDNARSLLQNSLPANILALMDLESLEICKDSFIEKDLRDYFSDMLYKVNLSGNPAYVYVLFEHKSYYDKYVHQGNCRTGTFWKGRRIYHDTCGKTSDGR